MKRQRNSQLDMSSMMDIIFILLVFVMISISFQKNIQLMELELPSREGSSKDIIDKKVQISVFTNGDIFVEKEKILLPELDSKIRSIKMENLQILLNIEKKVPYEHFIRISTILEKNQIRKVELGVVE